MGECPASLCRMVCRRNSNYALKQRKESLLHDPVCGGRCRQTFYLLQNSCRRRKDTTEYKAPRKSYFFGASCSVLRVMVSAVKAPIGLLPDDSRKANAIDWYGKLRRNDLSVMKWPCTILKNACVVSSAIFRNLRIQQWVSTFVVRCKAFLNLGGKHVRSPE